MDNNQIEVVRDDILPVERDWSSLLPEILEIIKSKLSVSDQIKCFSLVCKKWKSIPPFEFAYPADILPLLLFYGHAQGGDCNYYSPVFNKCFAVSCPLDLSGTTILATNDSWLLLLRGVFELLLVNPFTGISLKIPQLNDRCRFNAVAFSSPPRHPPFIFVVFGIMSYGKRVSISFCHVGGEEKARWSELQVHEYKNPVSFAASTPVFHNGLFYCLDESGTLATFDPLTEKWTVLEKPGRVNFLDTTFDPFSGRWIVLEKPRRFEKGFANIIYDCYIEEIFLVKSASKENLLSVFVTEGYNPLRVFKLNEVEMEWEEVTHLQGEALFAGTHASFASRVTLSDSNKVFLTRFRGEPETIHARAVEIQGQVCFLPEDRRQMLETTTTTTVARELGGVVYWPLESKGVNNKLEYENSLLYLHSIWYQP